jgi:hypothetical protein
MANTTFDGPVRSKNGFKTITTTAATGAITDGLVVNSSGNIYNTAGGHIQYAAATGYGPADLIIGKGGSQYGTANPYAESATQLFPLGSTLVYGNNVYRYVEAGGTAITAGKLLQHAAVVAHHSNMTATATTAAGETAISVETGGTDLTLNQYADGYLWVNDVNGEGQMLRVKSNPAHDHSADPSVVITTYDALATALTTSSQLSLLENPNTNLIVAPAAETGALMGATVIDMTADYYGWAVIKGPAALLTVGTLVVGNAAVRSGGTAGGVAPATDNVLQEVGDVMAVSASTEYSLINMNIG